MKTSDLLIAGGVVAVALYAVKQFSGNAEVRQAAAVEKVEVRQDAKVEKKLISAEQTQTRWEAASDIVDTIFKKKKSKGSGTLKYIPPAVVVSQTITPTSKNLTGISAASPFLNTSPNLSLTSGGSAYASNPTIKTLIPAKTYFS